MLRKYPLPERRSTWGAEWTDSPALGGMAGATKLSPAILWFSSSFELWFMQQKQKSWLINNGFYLYLLFLYFILTFIKGPELSVTVRLWLPWLCVKYKQKCIVQIHVKGINWEDKKIRLKVITLCFPMSIKHP